MNMMILVCSLQGPVKLLKMVKRFISQSGESSGAKIKHQQIDRGRNHESLRQIIKGFKWIRQLDCISTGCSHSFSMYSIFGGNILLEPLLTAELIHVGLLLRFGWFLFVNGFDLAFLLSSEWSFALKKKSGSLFLQLLLLAV